MVKRDRYRRCLRAGVNFNELAGHGVANFTFSAHNTIDRAFNFTIAIGDKPALFQNSFY